MIWNYFSCAAAAGMRFLMRLMGRSKLVKLARSGTNGISGAVAALCAELENACWASSASVAEAYPRATIDGEHIRIPVGDDHYVDLIARYDEEMVLVVFADSGAKAPRIDGAKGSRSE